MCDPESGNFVEPKAWNLCDDLGQIEYIFSDKTGTLTSNMMEFRKASINGIVYGDIFTSVDIQKESTKTMIDGLKEMFDTKYVSQTPSFVDKHIAAHLISGSIQAKKIREFFTLLAVCHTVLLEAPTKDNPTRLVYNAQSPDEAALVSTARDVGVAFIGRENSNCHINAMGELRTYSVLHIMEFNSDRKRMSVIIRRPEGQYVLLCKGADSVIYERLSSEFNDPKLLEKTLSHLSMFANDGLRTLCLAYRIIPDEEYAEWSVLYNKAHSEIFDRERKCDEAAELIENDLVLMGASAIEDKLQDGVPQAIETLYKAGIKLWGDKMETAINIGFSCNLLKKSMVLIVIQSISKDDTKRQLKEALDRFWDTSGLPIDGEIHALIVDGESLRFGLHESCKELLLELGCRCRSVVCCRVSPLQKAMVVKLVREGLGAMCLAIGDGANDVSMIQEADIGIGISGKEGLQAVMASDFAIGQFRFLSRLLLVHGKWAYVRSSSMVLNYFYKNVVWLMILFWHQFFSGYTIYNTRFDAGLVTDFTYSMFFNTVFTVLPTIFIGIFDQDINDKVSLLVPQLYKKGIRQELYGTNRFWQFLGFALFHSIACYAVGFFVVLDSAVGENGRDADLTSFGTIVSFGAIIVVNIYSIASWHTWTYITHLSLWISLVFWIIYVALYSLSSANATYGILTTVLAEAQFYLAVILIIVIALGPPFFFQYFQQTLSPTDTDIVKEILHIHKDFNWDTCTLGKKITEKQSEIPSNMERSTTHSKQLNAKNSSDSLAINSEHNQNIKGKKRMPMSGSGPKRTEEPLSTPLENEVFSSQIRYIKSKPHESRHHHAVGSLSQVGATSSNHGMPRQSSTSSIGNAFKKAGDFVKRLKSTAQISRFMQRESSLVYMGKNGGLVVNTGFCFSHDTGMRDMITPPTALGPVLEGDEEDQNGLDLKKHQSHVGNMDKFRRISTKIHDAALQFGVHLNPSHTKSLPRPKNPHEVPEKKRRLSNPKNRDQDISVAGPSCHESVPVRKSKPSPTDEAPESKIESPSNHSAPDESNN